MNTKYAASLNDGLDGGLDSGQDSGLTDGVVQMICEDRLMVAGRFGLARAVRAAGCLLAPEAGDRVLLAFVGEEAWVVSVLARSSARGALALPAHTEIRAKTLEFHGDEALTLKSDHLRAEGQTLELRAGVMLLAGKLLAQSFGVVRLVAGKLRETALRRQASYGKNREETLETAELSAGRLRVDCRHSARLRAENLDMKASELLDLDAGHIKIG
ncbi:MAG: DUF3540 domain-containing protein [Candidatus Accumulibacter sp.]|jgi:hypothetical protein|nr:DUF3540 domain-containing protein [Accumulibacter sp.]